MSSIAVIFDLNGTLVDTEIAHGNAYAEALAKYNVEFTLRDFTYYWTTKGKKLKEYLSDSGHKDLLPLEEAITEDKQKIFHNTFIEKSKLMPGAKQAVKRLKEHFKLGVETSGSGDNADKLLNHFEIYSFFDAIVTRDTAFNENKYGAHKDKTARLKYLTDSLQMNIKECVMVGDAEKDIQAAKDTGMKAIAVPNDYTKSNNFKLADKTINSLEDLSKESILFLFN